MFLSKDMSTLVLGASAGNNWAAGFNTQTGRWLWNLTLPQTAQIAAPMYNSDAWVIYFPNKNTFSCYDMLTGTLRWTTQDVGTYPYNTKGVTRCASDGTKYYISMPSGEVAALDYATGKVVWLSKAIPTTESSADVFSYWQLPIVQGGCVFVYAGYSLSYQIDPIQRFSMLVCINATTGANMWTLNGGIVPTAAANGYLHGYSPLDGYIYTLGKGKTSTSVSTQTDVISLGANVLVKGNVLDQSPAQPGTPAVSDASMNEWMDYLQFQNATLLNSPPTPNGVQVTLTAVDPNMNTVTVGTTTTDSTGNYAFLWTPQIEGQYTITANFAGSGSYWPSSSETPIAVNAAAATTAPTPTTSNGVSADTFNIAIAGLFVLIIVVAVVLALLMLRKRP